MDRGRLYLHIAVELLLNKNIRSLSFLGKAIREGNKNALVIFGLVCEFGIFTTKCAVNSLRFYEMGHEADCELSAFAASRIAFLKTYGRPGIVIDSTVGAKYCAYANRNAADATRFISYASNRGLAEAQFCLASCQFNGITTPKDFALAFYWCEKAAEQGLSQAQNLLGNMYIEGRGVERNPDEGLLWYRRAAEQKEATSMYNIGTLYEKGTGVVASLTSAMLWYQKAARCNSAMAHNVLGIYHEEGIVAHGSPKNAVTHYRVAAEMGNPHSQYNLGRCYHNEFGIGKDDNLALYWYGRAAKQGHSLAILSVAICHEYGIGTSTDMTKAIQFYKEAALLKSDLGRKRLIPIISWQIYNVSRVFFPTKAARNPFLALPVEIRLSILEFVNVKDVLTTEEILEIVNSPSDKSHEALTALEKSFKRSIGMSCSCPTKNCKNIMHVIMGLKDIEYV